MISIRYSPNRKEEIENIITRYGVIDNDVLGTHTIIYHLREGGFAIMWEDKVSPVVSIKNRELSDKLLIKFQEDKE